jgi:hypothetical protein
MIALGDAFIVVMVNLEELYLCVVDRHLDLIEVEVREYRTTFISWPAAHETKTPDNFLSLYGEPVKHPN